MGGGVLLLAASFLAPVPLGNVAPAPATDVIAVATLDEDRALLGSALAAALVVLVVASLAAWGAAGATGWASAGHPVAPAAVLFACAGPPGHGGRAYRAR